MPLPNLRQRYFNSNFTYTNLDDDCPFRIEWSVWSEVGSSYILNIFYCLSILCILLILYGLSREKKERQRRTIDEEVRLEHVARAAVVAEHGLVQVRLGPGVLRVERHDLRAARPIEHRVVVARADARAFRVDAQQALASEPNECARLDLQRALRIVFAERVGLVRGR